MVWGHLTNAAVAPLEPPNERANAIGTLEEGVRSYWGAGGDAV